ncbi:hypothetical protein JKP88DRAFT_152322, partial [Tribonema minus]
RLRPNEWLSGDVMTGYATLLNEREARRRAVNDRRSRRHVFHSFLYAGMCNNGYEGVKRWSTKAKVDVFACSLLVFLCNVNGNHWTVVVARMRQRRIEYFDSNGGAGVAEMDMIRSYLQQEHLDKKKSPLPGVWTRRSHGTSSPQQANGVDCGVFALTVAEYVVEDMPFDFRQDD